MKAKMILTVTKQEERNVLKDSDLLHLLLQ